MLCQVCPHIVLIVCRHISYNIIVFINIFIFFSQPACFLIFFQLKIVVVFLLHFLHKIQFNFIYSITVHSSHRPVVLLFRWTYIKLSNIYYMRDVWVLVPKWIIYTLKHRANEWMNERKAVKTAHSAHNQDKKPIRWEISRRKTWIHTFKLGAERESEIIKITHPIENLFVTFYRQNSFLLFLAVVFSSISYAICVSVCG